MVRKIDQYIRWKLAKNMGKMMRLYLSISLDLRPNILSPGSLGIETGGGGGGGAERGQSGQPRALASVISILHIIHW